jgi:hypothetical protein
VTFHSQKCLLHLIVVKIEQKASWKLLAETADPVVQTMEETLMKAAAVGA